MSVGYINPLMITQNTLKLNERETLNHIINFLDKHHDKVVMHRAAIQLWANNMYLISFSFSKITLHILRN
jgi:hypothetical protein